MTAKSRSTEDGTRQRTKALVPDTRPKAFSVGPDHKPKTPRTKAAIHLQYRGSMIDKYDLKGTVPNVQSLITVFEKAIARSKVDARVGSLRVDFGPEGALITEVEDAPVIEAVKEEAEPDLEIALEAARERGRLRAAEILGGDDMLTGEKLAVMLGTTRATINSKRLAGQLLGLDGVKRGFRFPTWQLDSVGKPYPALAALHDRLGSPWAVYRFLVRPSGELDGLTGRQALERGLTEKALEAAESVGRDFS